MFSFFHHSNYFRPVQHFITSCRVGLTYFLVRESPHQFRTNLSLKYMNPHGNSFFPDAEKPSKHNGLRTSMDFRQGMKSGPCTTIPNFILLYISLKIARRLFFCIDAYHYSAKSRVRQKKINPKTPPGGRPHGPPLRRSSCPFLQLTISHSFFLMLLPLSPGPSFSSTQGGRREGLPGLPNRPQGACC